MIRRILIEHTDRPAQELKGEAAARWEEWINSCGAAPSLPWRRTVGSCCLIRRKIMLGIMGILSEEQCGVSDVELADVIRHGADIDGQSLISFNYCPWCGMPREGEERIIKIEVSDE